MTDQADELRKIMEVKNLGLEPRGCCRCDGSGVVGGELLNRGGPVPYEVSPHYAPEYTCSRCSGTGIDPDAHCSECLCETPWPWPVCEVHLRDCLPDKVIS